MVQTNTFISTCALPDWCFCLELPVGLQDKLPASSHGLGLTVMLRIYPASRGLGVTVMLRIYPFAARELSVFCVRELSVLCVRII